MTRRRRPISMLSRIGDMQRSISPLLSSSVSQDDIINEINKLRETYNQEALSRYNAEQFNSAVIPSNYVQVTTSNNVLPIRSLMQRIRSLKQPVKSYANDQKGFVNDIYDSYYRTLTSGGTSDADARRQAKFLAQKAAYETGYGVHMANTHNYGGHRTKDKGWLAFNSMDDFTRRDVKLLDKKWSNWRNSKTDKDFVKAITTDNGQGIYAPENEYKDYYGLSNRVNSYLNMDRRDLRYGGKARPKAWIGAAIGAATSLLGGILNSNAQERQQREQRRLQEHNEAIERAQDLTESLGLMQAAQKEYEDRFRVPYSCGGRRKLRYGIRITDGGYAIPIGRNTFLLRGGSHEDVNETGQTGIGMKVGGKVVEAEDNEVVQKTPKEVRIFSDSIGIDGYSFAELARMGYNKDKLFNIQQNMNGNYGINSKRRLRNGGSISRPVERVVYEPGGYVYNPDYTSQQELDYILGNVVNTTPQHSGSATSPENIYLGGYTPQQMEKIMKPSTTTTKVEKNPPVNKFGTVFKGVDWAGLAADAIGSIGSALINYNAASNLQDPVAPVRVSPGKLITNYNIAPRLAEASMMRGRMLRDSDEGVSSATRLNRRNDINMYTNNYMDRLYGEKTNKEIELLNADTLNQQQVNTQAVKDYNDYMNRLIASRNNRNLLKAQAIQGGLSGLGDAVGNLFDQGKQRYSDQQSMRYYSALLPEEGRRYLKRSGVDFLRRGGKIY